MMFASRLWYVAAWSGEVGARPLDRQIAGQRLAIFRDSSGAARAVNALCPHRGHNLAEGRIVGDRLECPWHGWQFDGEGVCRAIPAQAANAPIPPTARTKGYPVREQDGAIMVWLDAECAPTHEPRRHEFFTRPDIRVLNYPAKAAGGGWLNTIENALNTAHLAFVHNKSMGTKLNPLVGDQKVEIDADGMGFRAWEDAPKRPDDVVTQKDIITGGPMKWFAAAIGLRKTVDRRTFTHLPGVHVVQFTYEDGAMEWVWSATTPGDAKHTWFFLRTIRTRGRTWLGDLMQRRFMRLLMEEDIGILERVVADGPFGMANPVSVPSDGKGLAFRRLYARALRTEGKPVPWMAGDRVQDPGPARVDASGAG